MDIGAWASTFNILRNQCIDDVRVLRGQGIQVGNPNTYGEITPRFVAQIIHEVGITKEDIFVDIGSGIGNVVLQVAAQVGCEAHGIEIREELTQIAVNMKEKLHEIWKKTDLPPTNIQFRTGDALSPEFDFSKATIIFLNNWCFGGELEHALFIKFQKTLPVGTKIICLKDAFPRFRPNSLRCKDLPCQRFRYPWRKFQSCYDAISWDSRLVECVVYQIVDHGCTLIEANCLINSITISQTTPKTRSGWDFPPNRLLFIDEAKWFLKEIKSQTFITPELSMEHKSYSDSDIIEKVKSQTFKASNGKEKPDVLIPFPPKRRERRFPYPKTFRLPYAPLYELKKRTRSTIFSPAPPKRKNGSKLFLRRNFTTAADRKALPMVFYFQKHPFVYGERDEAVIILSHAPEIFNGSLKKGLRPGSCHPMPKSSTVSGPFINLLTPIDTPRVSSRHFASNETEINSLFPAGQFLPLDPPKPKAKPKTYNPNTVNVVKKKKVVKTIKKRKKPPGSSLPRVKSVPLILPPRKYPTRNSPIVSTEEISKLFPSGQFLPLDPPTKKDAIHSLKITPDIPKLEQPSNPLAQPSKKKKKKAREVKRNLDLSDTDYGDFLTLYTDEYLDAYADDALQGDSDTSPDQYVPPRSSSIWELEHNLARPREYGTRRSNRSNREDINKLFPPGQFLPLDPPLRRITQKKHIPTKKKKEAKNMELGTTAASCEVSPVIGLANNVPLLTSLLVQKDSHPYASLDTNVYNNDQVGAVADTKQNKSLPRIQSAPEVSSSKSMSVLSSRVLPESSAAPPKKVQKRKRRGEVLKCPRPFVRLRDSKGYNTRNVRSGNTNDINTLFPPGQFLPVDPPKPKRTKKIIPTPIAPAESVQDILENTEEEKVDPEDTEDATVTDEENEGGLHAINEINRGIDEMDSATDEVVGKVTTSSGRGIERPEEFISVVDNNLLIPTDVSLLKLGRDRIRDEQSKQSVVPALLGVIAPPTPSIIQTPLTRYFTIVEQETIAEYVPLDNAKNGRKIKRPHRLDL